MTWEEHLRVSVGKDAGTQLTCRIRVAKAAGGIYSLPGGRRETPIHLRKGWTCDYLTMLLQWFRMKEINKD